MRYITADRIYPVSGAPIEKGVVAVDEKGMITAIGSSYDFPGLHPEVYHGWIVPGFVNTHCHLELSHMKDLVDTGTGLMPFITKVVKFRDFEANVIQNAIQKAENEMISNGIVAVGDISNKPDTFAAKHVGRLAYYTFVEMFDFFNEAFTASTFSQYMEVYEQLNTDLGNNAKSCVPHAPYSVSPALFRKLFEVQRSGQEELTISIHNQETVHENALFMGEPSDIPDTFSQFGIHMKGFKPTGRSAIHYAMDHMNPEHRTLFVHNTTTHADDINAAHRWSSKVFWASCPNANLYIENRLPDYKTFLNCNARLTLGTDSLTSNWQLCILEEMKTIQRFQSFVPFDALLQWATLNGAQALGFDQHLGTLEPGKKPGINLIQNVDVQRNRLTSDSVVMPLLN